MFCISAHSTMGAWSYIKGGEKPNKCYQCDSIIFLAHNLRKHLYFPEKSNHSITKPLLCISVQLEHDLQKIPMVGSSSWKKHLDDFQFCSIFT